MSVASAVKLHLYFHQTRVYSEYMNECSLGLLYVVSVTHTSIWIIPQA